MPRLDWQMWFAALRGYENEPWFAHFAARLLEGRPEVLALLAADPFADGEPPRYLRARLFEYRFSSPVSRAAASGGRASTCGPRPPSCRCGVRQHPGGEVPILLAARGAAYLPHSPHRGAPATRRPSTPVHGLPANDMKAIRFHAHGGPDVLQYEDAPEPKPAAGQAVVRLEAVGLNFIDTYHRAGLYPVTLPCTPGVEGAGTVVAVGEGVTAVAAGDRVAFAGALGAYAERAALPAERLVPLPDRVDADTAAAVLLQGMTAHYLATGAYPLRAGDTALIHAAAGGVGLLLTQIAKRRGARVIGTVSTRDKEQLARGAGADEVIRYSEVDFEAEVRRLTGNAGVNVVYDSVGRTTFDKGLNLLRPLGTMVLFGQSSGPVAPLDPQLLSQKGSLFLTRPTMVHYTLTRQALLARAGEVLGWVQGGQLHVRVGARFALAAAADAHRALEGRQTTGKVLLQP